MTVAEQIAAQNQRGRLYYVGRVFQVLIPLIVFALLFAVIRVNQKANDTAHQAKDTASAVAAVQSYTNTTICQSRSTTLRTAPQTVKEIRAVVDAESGAARKVCPHLDYARLDTERNLEIAKLAAGGDPNQIARSIYGKDGASGAPGAPGSVGRAGATGHIGATGAAGEAGRDGANGQDGARGDAGAAGPAGPPGPRGATGMQGPAGQPGPAGPVGPRGPAGPAGVSISLG